MARPPIKQIFNSIRGTWTLRRSLTSALPSFPSGTFIGTATLSPHSAFNNSSILYSESGELKTESGLVLKANKQYIYSYDEEKDQISAWFVREGDRPRGVVDNANPEHDDTGVQPDYLFHVLLFEDDQKDGSLKAIGDHLCIKDMYSAVYEFGLDIDGVVESWSLRYNVKGPAKDYVSETKFYR
ncbi:hypothetical protein ABW19_dt0204271 [Dactylella cylindrospora]|nr:hypothetical protein ABW19_dt0204271 [Dactylella cylindrospora]